MPYSSLPRRFTLVVWLSLGVSSCGARTALDAAMTEHPNEEAPTRPTPSPTAAATATTRFVESDIPVVLTPAPCTLRDAADTQPDQPSTPTPGPMRADNAAKGECGNGRHEEYESCDDGNRVALDGCDDTCQIEPYYVCPTGGQPCVRLSVCGDNVVSATETCDDGNRRSFDGCSPSCQIEAGCSPDPCTSGDPSGYCGDGVVQAHRGEACDNGMANTNAYEGCTDLCTLAARCGDGIVQPCGQETCDDGNHVGGDGCSANCRNEQQWVR